MFRCSTNRAEVGVAVGVVVGGGLEAAAGIGFVTALVVAEAGIAEPEVEVGVGVGVGVEFEVVIVVGVGVGIEAVIVAEAAWQIVGDD